MRVLYFDHTAALGGGEIALLNLVRYLDPNKVKPVVVLGAEGPLVEQLGATIETHVLPLPAGVAESKKDKLGMWSLLRGREVAGILGYVWRLSQFIREHDIDLVHTNSLKADIIAGIAGRLSSRPVVWHVRDRIEDDYLPRSVVRLFRLLCRVIPSFLIANSAATMRTIRPVKKNREDSSVANTNSHSTAIVVHDGTIVPRAVEAPTKTTGAFRIGLIGRISPWKGQHIFLEAAEHVLRSFPSARFAIVGAALFGEHEYERDLRGLAERLGIGDVVEFAGFCSDIGAVIATLDVIVHASITGEPFGQVIIEGMAAGKPIVATNGGGVPEIVEDGVTGILVPMGDVREMANAICEILADPARAREMGTRGRQRIENHFTVELTAKKVQAVYREMLGQRRS